MNMDDIELKLLVGMPVHIDGAGSVYSPTIKEIAKIGESKYNQYLSVMLFNKNNVQTELSDDISSFELVFAYAYHNSEFKELILESIEFFFKQKAHLDHKGQDVFFSFEDGMRIDKSNIGSVQEVVKISNWIKSQDNEEEQYKPANEEAAQMIREMLERRRKKQKASISVNLKSIVSGMIWKCPSIDIAEKTIFQLYDGYRRLQNLDSLHYTMFGIYTGNVDAKKINMKDLNFALILKDQ